MIKRSFFALAKPQFQYESMDISPEKEEIPAPKRATLLLNRPLDRTDPPKLSIGDSVKTGGKIALYEDCDVYAVSSVTGKVAAVSAYTGDLGASMTSVAIDLEGPDEEDEDTKSALKNVSLATASEYLEYLPGAPCFKAFNNPETEIDVIVVTGVDKDLLVSTNKYVVKTKTDAINRGISVLKSITGVHKVIIALSQELMKDAGAIGGASGAEIRVIDSAYPSALSNFIARDVLGRTVPVGKSLEELGMAFFSAEAVASVGLAFAERKMPVKKTLTLIKKDMKKVIVEAVIGTPVGDVLHAADVTVNEMDRIIIGGPMTGASIYTLDYPVGPDTDAVMVQDCSDIALYDDTPCINCGECVKICPAKVPVNMLVRFCEAGEYETAADQYDLYSCIECGLCTYVCVSKMPIFQYIRLAKYELSRMETAEETDA